LNCNFLFVVRLEEGVGLEAMALRSLCVASNVQFGACAIFCRQISDKNRFLRALGQLIVIRNEWRLAMNI
jgi:hypothetical protein